MEPLLNIVVTNVRMAPLNRTLWLEHHLKELKLPPFLRDNDSVGAVCGQLHEPGPHTGTTKKGYLLR